MIGWGGRASIALLVACGATACTGVSTDPQTPISLQFDSLPALAIVVGDTMRGGDLLPARVSVRAFNGNGTAVSDTLVRLIGIDTASVRSFRLIAGLRLVGTSETAAVSIVAQAGALQSQTQTFAVLPRPTGLERGSTNADSIIYDRPDTSTRFRDVSVALVRQVSPDSTKVPLNGLRVQFRVVNFTTTIVDSVRLVGTGSGRNTTSALMASGTAGVRVKVYAKPTATLRGVVTLEATHRALGTNVPGSPFQFTVTLVPFTLPR